MPRAFFETVADALVGFLPPALRDFSVAVGSRNCKVWYGEPASEHFEVQLIPRAALVAARVRVAPPALEVGFHAEHADPARNDAVLERLRARERAWRRALGKAPEAGPFVGRQTGWRRLSELWERADAEDHDAAIEAAERLARYVRALRPPL